MKEITGNVNDKLESATITSHPGKRPFDPYRRHFEKMGRYNKILNAFVEIKDRMGNNVEINEEVKAVIEKIAENPAKYGFNSLDFENDQHTTLLYHTIMQLLQDFYKYLQFSDQENDQRKQLEEAWEREKLSSPDPEHTYKKAFLGAGSSIAYVVALGKFDPEEAILIGQLQPWANERRSRVLGQPGYMVDPTGQLRGMADIDEKWANAEKFSGLIERIFVKSGIKREMEEIKKIEESKDKKFYCIKYGDKKNEKFIYAKEVIVGMGNGKQAIRGLFPEDQVAKDGGEEEVLTGKKRIMDMDMFVRIASELRRSSKLDGSSDLDGNSMELASSQGAHCPEKKPVVVIAGGNAAIDAVFGALKEGFRVIWVTGEDREKVPFLPHFTNCAARLPYLKYLCATEENQEKKKRYQREIDDIYEKNLLEHIYKHQGRKFEKVPEIFKESKFDDIHFTFVKTVERLNDHVKIILEDEKEIEGDYFVYGVGPDDRTFDILDEKIWEKMGVCDDLNQRFEGTAELTPLVLKTMDDTTGKSVTIIGAEAYRKLRLFFDGSFHPHGPLVNILDNLPPNVTVLTPVRSQVEALYEYVLPHAEHSPIFATHDRTVLAHYISLKYPAIADYESLVSARGKKVDRESSNSLLGKVVEMIVRSRRQKDIKSKYDIFTLKGPDVLPIPPNGREFQEYWENELRTLESSVDSSLCQENLEEIREEKSQVLENLEKVSSQKLGAEKTDHPGVPSLPKDQCSQTVLSQDIEETLEKPKNQMLEEMRTIEKAIENTDNTNDAKDIENIKNIEGMREEFSRIWGEFKSNCSLPEESSLIEAKKSPASLKQRRVKHFLT
jgi:soluble cytochrome b562